ncbi:MAG TPA: hypothetical protein VHS56_08830 [Candidatus Cybelea sp.]|nr:hypothetical protein [Candidatus Cybelea sp.]
MRRIVAVLTSAALALMLARAAQANLLPIPASQPDLASQLMLRLFGETADSTASFSAQNGDRVSESPLHELALRVPGTDSNNPQNSGGASVAVLAQQLAVNSLGTDASYLARAADAGLLSTQIRFAPATSQPSQGLSGTQSSLLTVAYQPVARVPNISPGPGTLAFDSTSSPAAPALTKDLPLEFNPDLKQSRGFNLSVSGQYEGSTPSDIAGLTAATPAAPAWHLPDADAALAAPNYAGSNKVSLRAGLAVPVVHGLTLNLNYDAQRSSGGTVLPGLENLDAANNSYIGRLTYTIPYSSSTLSVSAYQNRYGQSVLPLNGYTQTGEDVNFTVKF